MNGPRFDRSFDPRHGEAVRVCDLVRRITAANPGPFTFHGTNCYVVGEREVAVIDPGPDDPAQLAAIRAAIGSADVVAVVVTHTHRDHSPGAAALARATGAPLLGEGPHRAARPIADGDVRLDASGDTGFHPDRILADGDHISGEGWSLTAVATPGHCANHLAFALAEENLLLSGDHVMAWSTSIVAPPDGAMADYMASLERLADRGETRYLPGHGGPVEDPATFVPALIAHRRGRERAILDRLAAGDATIPTMVERIYAEVDRSLHRAAALSVLAHLEDLVERGIAAADGPPTLAAQFALRRG